LERPQREAEEKERLRQEEIAKQAELNRIKRERLLLEKTDTEKKLFAIADQLEKKSIEKTKLKSQIKVIALMYMKYRQFES